jgi:peroxiredoxin 2/4
MTSLVRRKAPGVTAPAAMPDDTVRQNLSLQDFAGRYVVLLFYPMDFSFVCPSEILALDARLDEFQSRDCAVLGISVDSVHTHLAWRRTPLDEGGIGPIRFPLVSDPTKKISREYEVLLDDAVALRATFLLDRGGVIRHLVVNDMDIGRSIDETLRTLDALRHFDETGELCPANWEKGKGAMQGTPAGVKTYLKAFKLGRR